MEKRTRFLAGVSDYLWKQTDSRGRLICYKHHLEHTGKTCYSIITDSKLYGLTGEAKYFQRAHLRAQRVAQNLVQDPEHGAWVFYPGRLAERNMSNSVIDGGACADALSCFYSNYSDILSPEDKDRISDVVWKHVETYLKKACVDKEVTNQRLWGATGVASAYRAFREPSWRQAAISSIERSIAEQNPDGSFPYHSYAQQYGAFVGIGDITPYYHSRHLAFMLHILEQLDESVAPFKDAIVRGANFLVAMIHPDGTKEMQLEAKRWYWESRYEVASNVFDTYALVKTYEHTGDKTYLEYAVKSYSQLLAHQMKDGGITSHIGRQDNLKCRIFLNGHVAWAARVIDRLTESDVNGATPRTLASFESAGVVRFQDENLSAVLRFAKKPLNICWGGALGGGLVYVGHKETGWRNTLTPSKWYAPADCHLDVKMGPRAIRSRFAEFWKDNWPNKDVRRRLWIAWVEFRAWKVLFSLLYPFRHILLPMLAYLSNTYSTRWDTNSAGQVLDNEVLLHVRPSRPNGKCLPGTIVERHFVFVNSRVEVRDTLRSSDDLKRVRFTFGKGVALKDVNSDMIIRRKKNRIDFVPRGEGQFLELRYQL